MKNIFKIIPFLIFVNSCKAQTPIINIEDDNGEAIQNAYYKDTNNLLNPFVGTYIYTYGTTSLTIILQKKTMSYNGYKYEDVLIGEYKYIENGVEKVNTLNELNVNYPNQSNHSISANAILSTGDYLCDHCVGNEKRLIGGLVELSTQNVAQLLINRILTDTGQQAIKINIGWQMRSHNPEFESPAAKPSFQGGNYVLIKQ